MSAFRPVEGFPCGHMGEVSQVFSKMSCDVHRFHFFLSLQKKSPAHQTKRHLSLPFCSTSKPAEHLGSFHTHVLEEGLLLSRTFAAAGFQRWVKLLESALLREGFYWRPSPHGDGVWNNWRSCSWGVLRGGAGETGGD